jgi:hypothetical protein
MFAWPHMMPELDFATQDAGGAVHVFLPLADDGP